MDFTLGIQVRIARLYNGRRSVWIKAALGRRTVWLSRWDTARCELGKAGQRIVWSGPVMTWYIGGLR
jgi:hypothetical protein